MAKRYLIIHICVSGFTQDRGYYHGILKLREELIAAGHASGPHRRVWYETWTANWEQLAADLSQVCIQHGFIPVVTVSGYSYGGFGATRLCFALEKRGIEVRVLTLCDPVGRRWWWPQPMPALTSLLSRDLAFTLPIAANVKLVNEFWQQENRPQGHRLHLIGETKRGVYQQLPYKHARMDDAVEFHDCVMQHADEIRTEIEQLEATCDHR